MTDKYDLKKGWAQHPNLREAHYWMASTANAKVQTLCEFAIAMSQTVREAKPEDEWCPDCAALEAAP